MIQTIRKAWGIPELQKKIVFTLLILLIYRIGSAIPVPYVDTATLKSYLDGMGTTILGLDHRTTGQERSERERQVYIKLIIRS